MGCGLLFDFGSGHVRGLEEREVDGERDEYKHGLQHRRLPAAAASEEPSEHRRCGPRQGDSSGVGHQTRRHGPVSDDGVNHRRADERDEHNRVEYGRETEQDGGVDVEQCGNAGDFAECLVFLAFGKEEQA